MKLNHKQTGFTAVELIVVVCGLFSLVVTGSIIYVGFHFLQKFW